MKIEEYLSFTLLFDTYGKLLSKKQFDVMDKFLNLDLSESELAELDGESRQSIHDAVVKAKKQLLSYEENLKIVENMQKIKLQLNEAKIYLDSNNLEMAKEKIDEMINKL